MRVTVSNLSFGYDYRTVLKDVNFSLKSGDFLAIIGNNGSGKSTLVKCLLGLNKVPPGRVYLDDVDITDFKTFRNIGYVPQSNEDFNYEFPITVNEILSASRFSRITEDKKLELLDKIGILELQNENINTLSGGQLQRVFIVRALMNDPKMIIFDEPTVGVDRENVKNFYKTVNELNKEGITVMLITHNLREASGNFTHILSLHNGEGVLKVIEDDEDED